MKKGFNILGFLFICGLGALLHFTFQWSGKSPIVAAFSAVNESSFEHLKLLYFPFLIFTFFEYFKYGKEICGFFTVKLKSLLISLGFIVVFFYTYQGVLGFNVDFLNIVEFIVAVAIGRIFESNSYNLVCSKNRDKISLISILCIGALFILFTFLTPKIGLFKDPAGFYGLTK